jgi:hypothetical protein
MLFSYGPRGQKPVRINFFISMLKYSLQTQILVVVHKQHKKSLVDFISIKCFYRPDAGDLSSFDKIFANTDVCSVH